MREDQLHQSARDYSRRSGPFDQITLLWMEDGSRLSSKKKSMENFEGALFNREQLIAGAVLGMAFHLWIVLLSKFVLDGWEFCITFAQAYRPSPWVCIGAPKFFRSAPNFPEQPLKCISAYMLHNKSYRVNCCEHFSCWVMLSHCWVS